MNRINLESIVGNLRFKNPIILASGTSGYGYELESYINLNKLGGFISKGIYYNLREGNDPPRIYETPCGMLNAIGLQGIGVKRFKREIIPFWEKYETNFGVNVAGEDEEEYVAVVEYLEKESRIDFFEINLSCPNVREGGKSPSWDPAITFSIIKNIKKISKKHIMAKLSPNVTYIEEIALAAEEGGADSISLVNTFVGLAVDIRTKKPMVKNVFGGVSGPAIKPMAVALVHKVAQAVKIPVIGIGGIMRAEDILEFIIAGASAVQIGTASIIDPQASAKILERLPKLMEELGYKDIKSLINSLIKGG